MTNSTHTTKTLLALGLAAVAAAALAPAAMAVGVTSDSDTSEVTAVVGAEISITATDPAAMTLSHFAVGTSIGSVDVVSTQPSWTVSIKDTDTVSPGNLDRTSGTGPASLALPFGYAPGLVIAGPVTGSYQTVFSSAANDDIQVGFGQYLDTGEDVIAGDTYATTVSYSAVAN